MEYDKAEKQCVYSLLPLQGPLCFDGLSMRRNYEARIAIYLSRCSFIYLFFFFLFFFYLFIYFIIIIIIIITIIFYVWSFILYIYCYRLFYVLLVKTFCWIERSSVSTKRCASSASADCACGCGLTARLIFLSCSYYSNNTIMETNLLHLIIT
jgi:hypothetical protein